MFYLFLNIFSNATVVNSTYCNMFQCYAKMYYDHSSMIEVHLFMEYWVERVQKVYQQTLENDEIDNLKKKCGEKVGWGKKDFH